MIVVTVMIRTIHGGMSSDRSISVWASRKIRRISNLIANAAITTATRRTTVTIRMERYPAGFLAAFRLVGDHALVSGGVRSQRSILADLSQL
jgi:hypothetical protein